MKQERPQFQYFVKAAFAPEKYVFVPKSLVVVCVARVDCSFYRFYYFTICALRKQDTNYLAIVLQLIHLQGSLPNVRVDPIPTEPLSTNTGFPTIHP